MIHTHVAYGYCLGGPGHWALKGMAPEDHLITPWYNETNPTHDLSERATKQIADGLLSRRPAPPRRTAHDVWTPILFETTIEVSPPGWTREASAPPTLGGQLPPSSPLLDLDRPATASYVLVVADSVSDLETADAALYDEDDGDDDIQDPRLDWDSLLDAALTEIGLQMSVMPDWFWYRTAFAD